MKKPVLSFLLVVTLLLLSQLPALAMEIEISDSGVVSFYNDQVLGREDERTNAAGSRESMQQRDGMQTGQAREAQPSRTMPANSDTRLRVSEEHTRVEVRLEDKKQMERPTDRIGFDDIEHTTTDRLRVETSAQLRDKNEERGERTEEKQMSRSEAAERALEERRNRTEEKIEIRNQQREDGTQEFQFESRSVQARLNGAEFILDPETNEVTVVTPSGEEKVLTHLPDQAIARMQERGFFDSVPGIDPEQVDLSIETKEDGRVVYSTVVEKEERLFGLFPRTVETKLELNDETGEVTEERVQQRSFLGRLLGF